MFLFSRNAAGHMLYFPAFMPCISDWKYWTTYSPSSGNSNSHKTGSSIRQNSECLHRWHDRSGGQSPAEKRSWASTSTGAFICVYTYTTATWKSLQIAADCKIIVCSELRGPEKVIHLEHEQEGQLGRANV